MLIAHQPGEVNDQKIGGFRDACVCAAFGAGERGRRTPDALCRVSGWSLLVLDRKMWTEKTGRLCGKFGCCSWGGG